VPKIDHHRLVTRTRRARELESVGRFGHGLANLREPKPSVDLHDMRVRPIACQYAGRHDRPEVEQGRQTSALGVGVEQQRWDLVRGKTSRKRHSQE
jgi:hypothetical protein